MGNLHSLLSGESTGRSAIACARLPCELQLAYLQAEVIQLLQNTWVDHVNKNDYQGGWDVLPLRCQRQHLTAHPILQGFAISEDDEWVNLPILAHCPHLTLLLSQLPCSVKSARLMRLKAGAAIKPHRDQGLCIELGEARLHLPIQSCAAVEFIVAQQTIPMVAGELWYFNADQVHEVYNRGTEDRINLVIDCIANEWLQQQVYAGAHL
jgi:hypothetical protein